MTCHVAPNNRWCERAAERGRENGAELLSLLQSLLLLVVVVVVLLLLLLLLAIVIMTM